MKAVLQGLGVLLLAVVLVLMGIVGYALYDINAGFSATDLTNVTVPAAGGERTLNAYLAQPEGDGTYPGVIMIHEWSGIREDMVEKADTLADEGFVVLAVDLYRGDVSTSFIGSLLNSATYPQDKIDADMLVFYDYLTGLEQVDTERIGVMGYCYGGMQTMIFAVENPDAVQVAMNYYGIRQPYSAAELEPMGAADVAVLGVFGAEDDIISAEDITQLDDALTQADVTHEITVYDGVGHAFVRALAGDSASAQAWGEGVDFLKTHLAAPDATG